MGLFDLNEKDKKTDAGKSSAEKPDGTKQTEIGKMSGYSSISDVASAAPSSVTPEGKPGAPSAKGAGAPLRETAKERESRLKAEERAKSMERVGRYWAKRLTNIPYDTWSKILMDNDLRLTKEEADELAEDLFMTLQAFDFDPTNKWMLLGGLLFTHGSVISLRLSRLADKEKLAEGTIIDGMVNERKSN